MLLESGGVSPAGTFGGMDAAAELTGMYSQRVSAGGTASGDPAQPNPAQLNCCQEGALPV
jgi:hypothetical protein